MPNIVSLENGNEAAVKHKRTSSTISVPNSPWSEASVFKNTLRKGMSSVTVCVGCVWTGGYVACVASVSVWFRGKEIPRKGTFGFDRARNETRAKK